MAQFSVEIIRLPGSVLGGNQHCVKLLGQRLMTRDFGRPIAEFRVRIAIFNGYTALDNPVTEAVA